MKGLISIAARVQDRLRAADFKFCFIGGIALQCWGEPRYTQDIDLHVTCAFGAERGVAETLSSIVRPRVVEAVDFATESRVYLGQSPEGVPVDVAFSGIEYEHRVMTRATDQSVSQDIFLHVCSAEDLVVMKVFANRTQDWADVESIATRQGIKLDWTLIEAELLPLLALRGKSHLPDQLRRIRAGGL